MISAKQRKQRSHLIGIVIFILFVLVSGFVLKTVGDTDDPFVNMSDIVDMRQMLAESEQAEALSPANADSGGDLAPTNSASADAGYALTWSAAGEMLYDLWFICATTAVVIVLSYPIKWLAKSLSQKRLASSAPRSPSRGQDSPVS